MADPDYADPDGARLPGADFYQNAAMAFAAAGIESGDPKSARYVNIPNFNLDSVAGALPAAGAAPPVPTTARPARPVASNSALPPHHFEVTLIREPAGGFGLSVQGGCDTDIPDVCVKRVFPASPAARAVPALTPGDIIVSVDGRSLAGATHADAIDAFRRCGAELRLLCRKRTSGPYVNVPTEDARAAAAAAVNAADDGPALAAKSSAAKAGPGGPKGGIAYENVPAMSAGASGAALAPALGKAKAAPLPPGANASASASTGASAGTPPLPPPRGSLICEVDRKGADAALSGKPAGTFLLRRSAANPSDFILVVSSGAGVEHIGPLGVREDQLPALIEHHRIRTDGLPCLLKNAL